MCAKLSNYLTTATNELTNHTHQRCTVVRTRRSFQLGVEKNMKSESFGEAAPPDFLVDLPTRSKHGWGPDFQATTELNMTSFIVARKR